MPTNQNPLNAIAPVRAAKQAARRDGRRVQSQYVHFSPGQCVMELVDEDGDLMYSRAIHDGRRWVVKQLYLTRAEFIELCRNLPPDGCP